MAKISGSELIAQSLVKHGIDHFFNIWGLGIVPLINAIHAHRDKIRYISALNETSLALIAEGYSRASRKPAFVNVYHTSGTALSMVAVTVAWADHSPLIITSTTSSRKLSKRDQYAAVPGPITEMTNQYVKWNWEIPLAERIPEAIERAVSIATTPPMGPVHLAFPMDVYDDLIDEEAIDFRHGILRRFDKFIAEEEGIQEAAKLLNKSQKILIAAGGEIGQYHASDDVVILAELLGAPIVSEGNKTYFLPCPGNHRLYSGQLNAILDIAHEADTVLVLGFEFTEAGAEGIGKFPFRNTNQNIIQITPNSADLGKQIVPNIGLIGHPEPTLKRLIEVLKSMPNNMAGRNRKWADDWIQKANKESLENISSARLDPSKPELVEDVINGLKEIFGEKLIMVDHSNSGGVYVNVKDLKNADQYYSISQKASAQGWGLPGAIGIQLANPDRRVALIVGDGGFMFTVQALYTAARYNIPLVVIVLNNQGWGAGQVDRSIKGGTEGDLFVGGFQKKPINIANIANDMGVPSTRLNSRDQVRSAIEQLAYQKGPYLCEVVVDSELLTTMRTKKSVNVGGMQR
jgi:thiamine pyrophosphate-dependent acetolactate synthase large subunit-like protein